jgi:hypothetical protein
VLVAFLFFDKSKYYIPKKKCKAPLSKQERERRALQVYKGNPNQQPKERTNVSLSTQKVYKGTQKENPKHPNSSKKPKPTTQHKNYTRKTRNNPTQQPNSRPSAPPEGTKTHSSIPTNPVAFLLSLKFEFLWVQKILWG